MATPVLKHVYGIESELDRAEIIGNIFMLTAFGAMLMVSISGYMIERIGRIKSLLLCEILTVIAILLQNVQNLSLLYLTRFFSGLVFGMGVPFGQVVIKELLPADFWNRGGLITYVCITFGIAVSFSLKSVFPIGFLTFHWKIILSACLPITVIRFFLILFTMRHETPQYYLNLSDRKGKDYSTLISKVVGKYFDRKKVESQISQLKQFHQKKKDAGSIGLKTIFSKEYKERLRAGLLLVIGEQFSGINFIIYFSEDTFKQLTGNGDNITLAVALSKILAGICGFWLMKKFGNKTLLKWTVYFQSLMFILSFAAIQFKINFILYLTVCGYIIGYATGLGPLCVAYCAQILPPVGLGFVLFVQWFLCMVLSKLTPLVEEFLGSNFLFIGFSFTCLITGFLFDKFLVETKGLSDLEIRKCFIEKFRFGVDDIESELTLDNKKGFSPSEDYEGKDSLDNEDED